MENNNWDKVIHVQSSLQAKEGQFAMFVGRWQPLHLAHKEMFQQAKTIVNATEELKKIVGLLKTISKTKEITESREVMKEIETFGDTILYRAIDKLFSGEFEAIDVIKFRDIYKGLEDALDKCFAVSDAILTIALKNN